jgi:Cd2+/Zn2+-exporting ATPase
MVGVGVEAQVEGRRVQVLKLSALESRGLHPSESATHWLEEAKTGGWTVVAVTEDDKLVGLIGLADAVRPGVRDILHRLRQAGVQHLVMLTGDSQGPAASVARQVGIEDVHAEALPDAKVRFIEELERTRGRTAMIGDGINDAPALAVATVGVAMGTGGSPAAIGAADVALIGDDLSNVDYALAIGRKSRRLIRQNITLAVAIVIVLVVGTLWRDMSMLTSVLGHEGSEVLIILNGLRVALR